MHSLAGIVRRGLPFVDSGATSATTLVLTLGAARALTVDEFGQYGVAVTLATVLLSLVQGGLIDVQLREQKGSSGAGYWSVERAFPLMLAVALLLSLLLWSLEHHACGSAGVVAVSMALPIGYLYCRVYWVRAYLIVAERSVLSVILSLVGLMLALVATGLVVLTRTQGWALLLAGHVWSLGAPGLVGYWALRASRPRDQGRIRSWNLAYAGENLVLVTTMQLSSVVATPWLGLSFSAGLRGASTLMGPLNVVFNGLRLVLIPRFGRTKNARSLFWICSLGMAVLSGLWAFAMYITLDTLGPHVLGDSSKTAQGMLGWVGLMYASQGLYLAAFLYARGLILDRAVRYARSVQLVVVILGTTLAILGREWPIYVAGNVVANCLAFLVIAISSRSRGV